MRLCLLVLVIISVAFAMSQKSPNRNSGPNVDNGSSRKRWVDPRVLNTVINQGVSSETVNALNSILNSGLVDANLLASYYYPLTVAYEGTQAGESYKYLFNFFANGAYNNYLKQLGVSTQNTAATNQPTTGNVGINPFLFSVNNPVPTPFTATPFTAAPRFIPGTAALNQITNLNNNPFANNANPFTAQNNQFTNLNNIPFNNVNPFTAQNNQFTNLNNNPFVALNNGFNINHPFANNVNQFPASNNNVNPFSVFNNNPFAGVTYQTAFTFNPFTGAFTPINTPLSLDPSFSQIYQYPVSFGSVQTLPPFGTGIPEQSSSTGFVNQPLVWVP